MDAGGRRKKNIANVFLHAQELLGQNGVIEGRIHRFLLVCVKERKKVSKSNVPPSAVACAKDMALLGEFTDDEAEQTVIYGISCEESARSHSSMS